MKVRCQMQTRPGMFTQYEGHVDARCNDLAQWDDVFQAAIRELQRIAFPDYNASMWKLMSFEQID